MDECKGPSTPKLLHVAAALVSDTYEAAKRHSRWRVAKRIPIFVPGCPITVPAPGAALVFMSTTAEDESFNSAMTQTFPTTVYSKDAGPTTDAAVLETSNGRGGPQQRLLPLGSTSHGSSNSIPDDAARRRTIAASFTIVSIALGAAIIGNMLVR